MFSVRPSKIQGRGCFANQSIRVGTVCYVPSYPIDEEDATFRSVCWGEEFFNVYSPFSFLNHDNDPNAELYLTEDDDWELYFLRQVGKDEEVTIDYGFDPSEDEDDVE